MKNVPLKKEILQRITIKIAKRVGVEGHRALVQMLREKFITFE